MAKLTRSPDLQLRSRTALFVWGDGLDYADIVHDSRPFIEVGLDQVDVEDLMLSAFRGGERNFDRIFDNAMIDLSNHFSVVIDDYDWGVEGKREKKHRSGRTWQKISDSGFLRDSQKLIVD